MIDDRFKFRVFDSNKIMTYLVGFAIPDFCKEGDGELNFIGLQGGFGGQIKGKLKEFNLMQSTGLKDKNGVLIYEGDVVLYEYDAGRLHKGVVNWCQYAFFANAINDEKETKILNLHPDYLEDMEVIGNIYEHQHLLECNE